MLATAMPPGTVTFPEGLFGYTYLQNYVIKPIPELDLMPSLYWLESTQDPEIVFVIKHIEDTHGLIKKADIQEASQQLNFDINTVQTYVIVTLAKSLSSNNLDFYLNLKAPLIVDRSQGKAAQCVLLDRAYTFRHLWKR